MARTGAKKGHSPTWYVAAEGLEEQQAVLAGLLPDRSPDAGYRFALVWGLGSKAAAAKALEALKPEVEAAVEKLRERFERQPVGAEQRGGNDKAAGWSTGYDGSNKATGWG